MIKQKWLVACCLASSLGCDRRDVVAPVADGDLRLVPYSGSTTVLDEAGSDMPFCTLGSSACGYTTVVINRQDDIAYADANSFTQGGKRAALSVVGLLTVRNGFQIPLADELACAGVGVTVCVAWAQLATDCSNNVSRASASSFHTATFLNFKTFTGSTSSSDICEESPGSGGGSGGQACTTEYFIVEVWNEQTGVWQYHSTVSAIVCT